MLLQACLSDSDVSLLVFSTRLQLGVSDRPYIVVEACNALRPTQSLRGSSEQYQVSCLGCCGSWLIVYWPACLALHLLSSCMGIDFLK